MKQFKKWVMILSLAGPTVIVPSCSSLFLTNMRDAAIAGTADFIKATTFDALDGFGIIDGLFPTGTGE